ncbi:MAG: hypothetical protein JWM27_3095 [Gemmatimonadetes bacterium]|nr:hypothetical protein [Gemmatimonadota bacterium]
MVIGGVERLVDTEGFEVYSRPLTRTSALRRTPDQVRREHVSAWLEHALAALEGTVRLEARAGLRSPVPGEPATPEAAACVCVERAVNALLVFHQVEAGKNTGVDGMVALLNGADRSRMQSVMATFAGLQGRASARARRVLGEILRRLGEDAGMRPYLAPSKARLQRVAAD